MSESIGTRPPLPPFTRKTAIQKVRMAEMVGIVEIRSAFLWCIRQIRNSVIAPSFPKGASR